MRIPEIFCCRNRPERELWKQNANLSNGLYLPPSGPPPLLPVEFDKISEANRQQFASQGWATVNLDGSSDPLLSSFQSLFAASKLFFDLPRSEKEKYNVTSAGSEAGWSRVEGEKELITLRTDIEADMPEVLRVPAQDCWRLCGEFIDGMVGKIARSLGLPPEALTVFSQPCVEMKSVKTATMLRLFRYEGGQEDEAKVVAEQHNDIGLLSLVIGDTPGLQVWDRYRNCWHPIEEYYTKPTASVLVGMQLSRLSNQRYLPGAHRVVSSPKPTSAANPSNYRYSIVFILRAHSPVPISTSSLTTVFTGPFQQPMEGITAGQLHSEITKSLFNINISKEIREEQKQRLKNRENQQDVGIDNNRYYS